MKYFFPKPSTRNRRLYIPAISIVLGVLLLLVLITISTYRNLDRDKERAIENSRRQAITLLRTLEAGARTGMSLPYWREDSIRILLEETGRDANVAYLYLCDDNGRILHHSIRSIEGTESTWHPQIDDANPAAYRLRKFNDGTLVLDVAKRFMPLLPLHRHITSEKISDPSAFIPHTHYGTVIILGLRMGHLKDYRRDDIRHAVVMGAIVLALGSGALFFIFVIQNYYLIEKTLHSTEDYARKIVDSMASGLISVDADGQVVTYNQNALDLLGLLAKEVEGMNLGQLIDLEQTHIALTMRDQSSVMNREIAYKTPDGRDSALSISATPLNDDSGRNSGAVILINDLRQIRQLEEKVRRSEKLAALGKLAAGVAHEIRNPLSSIRGFAGFLANALSDNPKEQGYAEIMVREVDRINRVVTDLLTFANPLKVQEKPVNLLELIAHVETLVKADAKAQGLRITKSLPSTMPTLLLDENHITQALLNLLLNAIQFSPKGSGMVEIGGRWEPVDKELQLWVEDNGPGLSNEQRNSMFDPFFTTRPKGTGIGLAIVHTIIANHGGYIEVESPPAGKTAGTRVTLILLPQTVEINHENKNSHRG